MLRTLLGHFPFFALQRTAIGQLVLVYYHLVSDEHAAHVASLYRYKTIREFRNDLAFLRRYYSPVSLQEVISWNNGDGTLPRNPLLVSFDDGFREVYDVAAPILREEGIPATFFVSSAFVDNRELCYQAKASLLVAAIKSRNISAQVTSEAADVLTAMGVAAGDLGQRLLAVDYGRRAVLDRIAQLLDVDFDEYLLHNRPYLSSEQIRGLLDQGFTIGAHSIDHPYYSSLSLAEQLEQTLASVRWVRDAFKLGYGAFAFPHHDTGVSDEFFKIVRDSGLVDLTFGTNGMLRSASRGHFQRVSLENPLRPAKELLSWQYARRLYKLTAGTVAAA